MSRMRKDLPPKKKKVLEWKINWEVPTLDLCKKMKELGYPQNKRGWRWVEILEEGKTSSWHLISPYEDPEEYAYVKGDIVSQIIYAPTNGELGEQLPEGFCEFKFNNKFWIKNKEDYDYLVSDDIEVNARSNMWIWLRKNGYI